MWYPFLIVCIAFIYKMCNLGKCMRKLSVCKRKDPVKSLDLLHWENKCFTLFSPCLFETKVFVKKRLQSKWVDSTYIIHNTVIVTWSIINIFFGTYFLKSSNNETVMMIQLMSNFSKSEKYLWEEYPIKEYLYEGYWMV